MSHDSILLIINRCLVKYKRALAAPDGRDPISGRTLTEIALHLSTSFPIHYSARIQHGMATLRRAAHKEGIPT